MDIFETSSPSYVLMSSVEKCTDFLENCNKSFNNYKQLLERFYSEINKIKSIHCLKNDDITIIVLRADGCNGVQLAEHLREYKIEPEAVMNRYVILISTVADTKEGFEKLIFALKNLKKRSDIRYELFSLEIPKKYCNPFEVVDFSQTCLSDASGKVSAEYIFAYPPGSPIIVPGEIITNDIVNFIEKSIKNGVNIISDSNLLPSKILTKE
ncbi:MAG: hypothetical protein LIO62_08210, partial [Clostridiales bacterium]|nr:hypothetical protein [Clostridiales bacterium]